jgi:hypothetical protein
MIKKRLSGLLILLLFTLSLSATATRAEYLLQSARHFETGAPDLRGS